MLFLYSFFSMLLNLICSPLKELIFNYVYFNYGDDVLLCFYWFVGVCYYWHDKSEWGKSWWYLCWLETSTWDILWKPDIEEESISVIFVISLESWTVRELKFSSKVLTFDWPLLVTQSWILLLRENAKNILIKIMDLICCIYTKICCRSTSVI